MTQYLHLMDWSPAYFDPKTNAIYFYTHYGKAAPLATSLRQIRREQRLDKKHNTASSTAITYGYCRVSTVEED